MADICKLLAKHTHVIEVEEESLDKSDLIVAKVIVGCENLDKIPTNLMVVLGKQHCNIQIKVMAHFGVVMAPHGGVQLEKNKPRGEGEYKTK